MGVRASMAAAGAAALSAVLLLSLISPERNEGHRSLITAKSVFRNNSEHSLSTQTLVDQLTGLQLSESLHSVNWNHAVLSIDIAADPNWSVNDKESLFTDISKLIHFSFWDVHNVNRLQIRFLDINNSDGNRVEIGNYGNTKEILLLSADIRKSDAWLAEGFIPNDDHDLQTLQWQNRLRIHVTKAWEERYSDRTGNDL